MENNASPILAPNFIHEQIDRDLQSGKATKVHTRFPPEPNGYLHIGHCKAMVIDFGTAEKYQGLCNLRMDDTNPAKEDAEYVDAIKEDIHWMGFDWGDRFFYGSDYFAQDYEFAKELIKKGLAYVCSLSPEQMDEYRGDLTHPAVSPERDRPIEESLDLFERMKNGEFAEGAYTLRAKIDLASGNFWLRDPVIYRIKYTHHHRQGNRWCIYPMYDFAHPIQDALEGITYSLCSLEYEIHRPLYDWVIANVSVPSKPRQIEFARLNLTYTVLSKRFLRYLVENNLVDGWDDPRMPTLCALRRRGYTPFAIKDFISRAGIAKTDSLVDIELLEHCVREELNAKAARRICVLDPIKVVIDNYPADQVEYFPLPNNPTDPTAGTRDVPFTREIYIDATDFAQDPPPKFFRLKPDGEVRLMGAYIIKCGEIEYNEDGTIRLIHATADLVTRNNNPTDRKVKGTIHWVSATQCCDITCRLYDHLFVTENMNAVDSDQYVDHLNPASLIEKTGCKAEMALAQAKAGETFQFVRVGYFCKDSKTDAFNRTVTLKSAFKPKQC